VAGVDRTVGAAEATADVGLLPSAVVGAADTADGGREPVALLTGVGDRGNEPVALLTEGGGDGVAGRPAFLAVPRVQLVISNAATPVTAAAAALRPSTRPPGVLGASDRWA
jgi:hypothetical protein